MQNYQLHLTGTVGRRDFNRGYVDYVLSQNEGRPVSVLIDSLGGSLATALSIAAAFRSHGHVSVHFTGMNASAATIASMGAEKITMDSAAMYLVHKCSAEVFQWDSMNADQLQSLIDSIEQMKTDLDKMDTNVARLYSSRCKKPTDELLALMKVGGWLTAEEALAWGFVDEITTYEDEEAPVMTDKLASAMASAGIPIPDMPTAQSENILSRLISSLTALFRSEEHKASQEPQIPKTIIMKTPETLCKLLAVESVSFEDEKTVLTQKQIEAIEAQLTAHEAVLAERDAKISDLEKQVETLSAKPGDDTHQVVDDKQAKTEPANEVEAYIATRQTAQALFDSLPTL